MQQQLTGIVDNYDKNGRPAGIEVRQPTTQPMQSTPVSYWQYYGKFTGTPNGCPGIKPEERVAPSYPEVLPKTEAEKPAEVKTVRQKKCAEICEFDFKCLLSTRKMLNCIGRTIFYDGYDFKFVSNRNPHPNQGKIKWLCLHYMMTVIIPNALLGKKYGVQIPPDAPGKALAYCMETGKNEDSIVAFRGMIGEEWGDIIEKYNLYVNNVKREGNPVDKGTEWFFDKYVNLHITEDSLDCKDKFRKGKSQDGVRELMERLEKEPELKSMTYRQLLDKGIPQRTAKLFMKSRRKP